MSSTLETKKNPSGSANDKLDGQGAPEDHPGHAASPSANQSSDIEGGNKDPEDSQVKNGHAPLPLPPLSNHHPEPRVDSTHGSILSHDDKHAENDSGCALLCGWQANVALTMLLLLLPAVIASFIRSPWKDDEDNAPRGNEADSLPSAMPTANGRLGDRCFEDGAELRQAVDDYWSNNGSLDTQVAAIHGYPIGSWCVDNVESFSFLFSVTRSSNLAGFHEDISSWNMSSAQDLSFMFEGQKTFNVDISGWDVGNVVNMKAIFQEATSFNQALAPWNVSQVMDMSFMFWGASSFNQPVAWWDVSHVQTMEAMFWDASSFNQDLSRWNISSVQNFHGMFGACTSFQQDLCDWGNRIMGTNDDADGASVNVSGMFLNTNCYSTSDPDLSEDPKGDFCFSCGWKGVFGSSSTP